MAGAAPAPVPPVARRARRDRPSDEELAFAARLLAALEATPEAERAERLARALERA